MTYTASYPLRWPEGWERTPPARRRDSGHFQVTFERAMKDLFAHLTALHAKSIVLSSFLPLGRDGNVLGGNARTRYADPGVAVYFFRGERQFVLARDAFDSPLANLRSVGLALEGLRQVERHGGAHLAERAFGGFAALPPPPAPEKPWREVLHMRDDADIPPDETLEVAEAMYRAYIKRHHADKGGSNDRTVELNAAIASARKELRPGEPA